MKYFLLALLWLGTFSVSLAGPEDIMGRSDLDSALYPFYHGVASGDPTPNTVILWTRVTPDLPGTINGTWRIGLDTLMTQIVQSGNFTTDESRDYTVKVKAEGLQPDTWYYYEFTVGARNSLTGRTKTAPAGGREQLRFAFVSCSNYPSGYFNAYEALWRRNDVDAVLHLGDYIYEGGGSGISGDQQPTHEILNLADYRLRHSTYKLDPSLRRLHQQFPFITVWDDHETADNSYMDGANNHDPATEGPWAPRKAAGEQAYDEWMPIDLPESGNPNKIWRKLSYGNLADLFMLDTRLYARTIQTNQPNDTTKHILGTEQLTWLQQGLLNSTAKWKIIGQQVVMAPLTPLGPTVVNNDQWDGYNVERKKLYDFILNNNIQNVVVLTGDIHTAWANDLPYNTNTYNAFTGAGSVGVEFVCTAVSSNSSPVPLDNWYGLIKIIMPYIKYVDLHEKGFSILDLTNAKAQGNFYSVNDVSAPDTSHRFEEAHYTVPGTRWLKKATGPSVLQGSKQPYAPFLPRIGLPTGIRQQPAELVIVSAYPNPFIDRILVQYNCFQAIPVVFDIYDMSGKLVKRIDSGTPGKGLHQEVIDLSDIARGQYTLMMRSSQGWTERSIQKF